MRAAIDIAFAPTGMIAEAGDNTARIAESDRAMFGKFVNKQGNMVKGNAFNSGRALRGHR